MHLGMALKVRGVSVLAILLLFAVSTAKAGNDDEALAPLPESEIRYLEDCLKTLFIDTSCFAEVVKAASSKDPAHISPRCCGVLYVTIGEECIEKGFEALYPFIPNLGNKIKAACYR
ncbi:hypothetical protein KSP40_PGU006844 [Platanthera guangdongensis]|uniref:Prolamin-like domain-containing protein n=1 Tax=Platanthera guangdongensis TaxID=2320717 RepID=A0ABR2MM38_9ASPA